MRIMFCGAWQRMIGHTTQHSKPNTAVLNMEWEGGGTGNRRPLWSALLFGKTERRNRIKEYEQHDKKDMEQ